MKRDYAAHGYDGGINLLTSTYAGELGCRDGYEIMV